MRVPLKLAFGPYRGRGRSPRSLEPLYRSRAVVVGDARTMEEGRGPSEDDRGGLAGSDAERMTPCAGSRTDRGAVRESTTASSFSGWRVVSRPLVFARRSAGEGFPRLEVLVRTEQSSVLSAPRALRREGHSTCVVESGRREANLFSNTLCAAENDLGPEGGRAFRVVTTREPR